MIRLRLVLWHLIVLGCCADLHFFDQTYSPSGLSSFGGDLGDLGDFGGDLHQEKPSQVFMAFYSFC